MTVSRLSDEDLMNRFRDTLDECFIDELTARYYGRALTIAEGRIFDPESARDAVQTAFIKIIRKRHTYDGRKFSSWFFTVLKHVCTDAVRREMRYVDKLKRYSEAAVASPAHTAPSGHIRELLARLTPEDRELMVYRYVQGMTYEEAGALLGCSAEAAKKRGQRALEKLRRQIVPGSGNEA